MTPPIARTLTLVLPVLALLAPPAAPQEARQRLTRPDVVLITVDTLRYDRLSAHGYRRPTSPHLDALLAGSARFDQARAVEPLTGPSMVSLITSRYPHHHGASRNGLRMRPEMLGLGKVLKARGYVTAAFVGNWTLRDELCGLGEHFDEYHEVFSRKRWLGTFKGEATAEDLTDDALEWVDDHLDAPRRRPFLLWVHYVEPHAPYRLHEQFRGRLGITRRDEVDAGDRYDTEVAFVDHAIGRLLRGLDRSRGGAGTLIAFSSDHGESLGEHGYWGHGRHAYDVTLRIPMSFAWEGRIAPRSIAALASNLDVAPTVLGLIGLPSPEEFAGHDFSAALRDAAAPPAGRITYHQAHKGVTKGRSGEARQRGLLEVAVVEGGRKEILRVRGGRARRVFDLGADPYENDNGVGPGSSASAALLSWLAAVQTGLVAADLLPTTPLDDESLEKMRALGYVE